MNFEVNGVDPRVPGVRARYYRTDAFGGADGRGRPASLRLLNVKQSAIAKAPAIQRAILKALASEDGYTNFLLQSVNFTDSEKTQIMHTFGDGYVNYFYGRNPRQMSITGMLFDDLDNDWFYRFLIAYDKFLRGTSLAKNYRLVAVTLPNMVVIGSVLDFTYSQTSENDSNISFTMNFVVKEIRPISSTIIPGERNDDSNYKNIFAPTARDTATLSAAEINRANARIPLSSRAADQNTRQEEVARFMFDTQGSGLVLADDEQAQGIYSQFAKNSATSAFFKTKFEQFKKSAFYKGVEGFLKKASEKLESTTNFFRNIISNIYALSSLLSGIPKAINDITSAILAPLKALLDIPNALKSVVYAIKLVKDSIVSAISNIKNTFNQLKQAFKNARATLLSSPDTFAVKLSAGAQQNTFTSVKSLGSYTSNVVDSEAVAVLSLLNTRKPETYETLTSPENRVGSEDRISTLFSGVPTL